MDDNGPFWNWVLNRKLAFGPGLNSEADAASLRRHGFTAILDVDQGNRQNESRWAKRHSLRYLGREYDRIRESFQVISLEKLETIASRIQDLLLPEAHLRLYAVKSSWASAGAPNGRALRARFNRLTATRQKSGILDGEVHETTTM